LVSILFKKITLSVHVI